ncbi:MAG: hypothetical protein HY430_02400 [Candidatus Levybacteria bacterium]|nr:hypothetical protein [Candidatus Levybacteria bacterium]
MAKNRKTRKEKKLADLRHTSFVEGRTITASQPTQEPPRGISYSFSSASPSPLQTKTSVAAIDYSYVKTDLLKTTLLTSAIIIAELVLFSLKLW